MFLVLQIPAFHIPGFTDSGFSCSWFYRFRLFMFLVLQIPAFHVPGFLVPFPDSPFLVLQIALKKLLLISYHRKLKCTAVIWDLMYDMAFFSGIKFTFPKMSVLNFANMSHLPKRHVHFKGPICSSEVVHSGKEVTCF